MWTYPNAVRASSVQKMHDEASSSRKVFSWISFRCFRRSPIILVFLQNQLRSNQAWKYFPVLLFAGLYTPNNNHKSELLKFFGRCRRRRVQYPEIFLLLILDEIRKNRYFLFNVGLLWTGMAASKKPSRILSKKSFYVQSRLVEDIRTDRCQYSSTIIQVFSASDFKRKITSEVIWVQCQETSNI